VPSGPAAVSVLPMVEAVLAGREPAMLPVPADDVRQTRSLTKALRVDHDIDDDVAVVMSTSGTTGTPKGAMLTAAALTASAEATHRRLGGPGRWLLALPAYHIAGLQVLVRSVIAGSAPVVVASNFDVAELPAAITSMGAGPRYASLVAAQLDKVLADTSATAALAELDAVLIGGGPMPPKVAERASAAGISVIRTYGMSETAGGCVYNGVPLAGVQTRVDLDGRIALGGKTLAKGYRNPIEPDPFTEPGWFLTDDVGALDASGMLRVLGRTDDAISTGGLTVFPQLVETALASHPRVADCAVFGVPDDRLGQRVVAAIVAADGDEPPTLAELRTHVGALLDPTAAPKEMHVVDEVPRRGIGKVDRRKLVEMFG
jgi:o-succinylbenzoate---CoA ligase